MLSPRSYTPPPRTKTLPRSRAAGELYFSANGPYSPSVGVVVYWRPCAYFGKAVLEKRKRASFTEREYKNNTQNTYDLAKKKAHVRHYTTTPTLGEYGPFRYSDSQPQRSVIFVISSFSSRAAGLRYSTFVRVLLCRTVTRRFI